MPGTVRMIPVGGGAVREVPTEEVGVYETQRWTRETPEAQAAHVADAAIDEYYSSPQAKLAAGGLALGRTVTGGLSDLAIRAAGSDRDRADVAALREHNKGLSTAVEVAGSFLPGGAGGLATQAGERVAAKLGKGSIAGAIGGGAVEGVIQGAGNAATDIALSSDQLTFENAAAAIGSNVAFGAGIGGAIGGVGKLAEKGLSRAARKLDDIAARPQLADDAVRAEQRAAVADELKAFRQEQKQNKLFLATKDAEGEVREVAARSAKADKQLRNLLDNPIRLAEKPELAKAALQQQEAALRDLVEKHSEGLRKTFAADASGARTAALDYAPVALQKNLDLQAKIAELAVKPAAKAAAGGIGAAIGDAAGGYALASLAGLPIIGQAVAAGKVGMAIVKKLGVDTSAAAARGSKAINTFLDVGAKVGPKARLAATKTLASVAYGAASEKTSTKKPQLADVYKSRSQELRSLTAPGPDGKPVMRMEERQKLSDRIAPIRAAHPVLADQIETNKARAVEYLSSKLPRKPDLPSFGHDDNWQPSDMEMRTFARHVAAVEDPHGVTERLASGQVTPEDAEAMKAVYPEMYADIQRQIMGQVGELRAKLPYARRLALSIFSGVPVDPALDPRVLSVLQSSFTSEPGTEGGVQAPVAQPAFGSVTKPEPTAGQGRGG